MPNPITWDGGVLTSENKGDAIHLTCSPGWQASIPVETGQESFPVACRLMPMGDRLLLLVTCENERGGTFCYTQVLCVSSGGVLLWSRMVDSYGGECGALRLEQGIAVIGAWARPGGQGLRDLEAQLLDVNTGETLKTHVVPVVADLPQRTWDYSPYIYGAADGVRFGVRVSATAAPLVPPRLGQTRQTLGSLRSDQKSLPATCQQLAPAIHGCLA